MKFNRLELDILSNSRRAVRRCRIKKKKKQLFSIKTIVENVCL